jgi:hypothetical protein
MKLESFVFEIRKIRFIESSEVNTNLYLDTFDLLLKRMKRDKWNRNSHK